MDDGAEPAPTDQHRATDRSLSPLRRRAADARFRDPRHEPAVRGNADAHLSLQAVQSSVRPASAGDAYRWERPERKRQRDWQVTASGAGASPIWAMSG